jgi:hypothetical protein
MAKRSHASFLKKWCEHRSLEELKAAVSLIEEAAKRGTAIADLDQHPLVAKVHEAMELAATETGTTTDDVRLAELRRFGEDIASYERRIAKHTEQWKKDHATHRNPDNPVQTWHSPDGRGNPARWIRERIGKKPDPKKDPEGCKEWMRKLEQFRVDRSEADTAA